MNKIEEMKALVEKLNQYRDAYYNNAERVLLRIISMMICVISWKKWKKKQELF